MSLLRSKAIRVFLSNLGVMTDLTESCRTWGAPNHAMSWDASDHALYVGQPHAFNNLYLALSQMNTNPGLLGAAFWDGTAWEPFSDLLDETSGFSASGFIQWEDQATWKKAAPADISGMTALTFKQELYWIKFTLSADSSPITIQAIKQLLSDDRMMNVIHPEIMGYMPDGQSNYLPQHELARDIVVKDLIIQGVIKHELQIKNVEDFILPATYKCAELILAPIVGDERLKAIKDEMKANYYRYLNNSGSTIDNNNNGVADPEEIEPGKTTHLGR